MTQKKNECPYIVELAAWIVVGGFIGIMLAWLFL